MKISTKKPAAKKTARRRCGAMSSKPAHSKTPGRCGSK